MRSFAILFVVYFFVNCQTNVDRDKTSINKLEEMANQRFKKGDYKSAIKIFEKLINGHSQNSGKYLYSLAVCRSLNGEYDSSSKDLLASIGKDYNRKESYYLLAQNSIKDKNDTAQALSYINKAHQIDLKDTSIIIYKLVLMGEEAAMKFTLDSLL